MTGDPDSGPRSLLGLTPAETERAVVERGGRAFHARSLRRHVFQRATVDYAQMTDLPSGLRERLDAELPILVGEARATRVAPDGTTKFLTRFGARRGVGGSVETVHIQSGRADRGATLCVSTQIGCPVRCPFCASGKQGLERNLDGAEILEQYVRGLLVGPYARTVVMGIGEPLLNLPALTHALDAVRDEIGLGARRITVSTVGFPDRLRRLAETNPRFQLAISLHTPFDEQRDELVPLMAGTPIDEVLAAGDHWFELTGREVTYEYVLLGRTNDSDEHARRLLERLRGRRATVNLIPYNPIEGDRWQRPSGPAVEDFRAMLERGGLVATVRWSKGVAADAACGQLRQRDAAGDAPKAPIP